MDKSWDSLTPKGLRNAKIFSVVFIVVSILVFIFLSTSIGKILLGIGVIFGLGPFILGSKGSVKNKIHVLKMVEPGYNNWKDEEIEKQLKAIGECGYKWFEKRGRVGFKHTKTGLYLKIEGLHFYKPEEIKKVYREVWSKDDSATLRKFEKEMLAIKKLAETIPDGATDEEIEAIFEEQQINKNQ